MSRITGKETKPEILVRKYLFSKGYRFRKNVKTLPGSPDIVLPKYRTVIFIHGCFWHGHARCGKARLPSTNAEFWKHKITSNCERDKKNNVLLKKRNWIVITVWQCEIANKDKVNRTLEKVIKRIKANDSTSS